MKARICELLSSHGMMLKTPESPTTRATGGTTNGRIVMRSMTGRTRGRRRCTQ